MYDLTDIILVGILGLFLGVFISMVGFKLYIAMVCQPPYTEEDDFPAADWCVKGEDYEP